MAEQSRQSCRFFNSPGGCRWGTSCRFAHDRARNSRVHQRSPSLGGAQNSGSANAPPGVCRAFWADGECRHGFGCRFKHIPPPSHTQTPRAESPQGTFLSAVDTIAPLLNAGGLAKLTERSTDNFFAVDPSKQLAPSEVHNHLKRYLFDDYRFRHVLDMYSFLSLVGNASTNNAKWVSDLLPSPHYHALIDSGNGLRRLNDILVWEDVSVRAGSSRTTLSFQRGYVPLLRYFSSESVATSIASHAVNALYALILEHCDHFASVVQRCMEEAITVKKSFKDIYALPAGGKDPLVSQVIAALAKVLFELVTRFKNVLVTHPALRPFVLSLRQWTVAWVAGITSAPPTFDDPLTTTSPLARDHIVQHLNSQVDRLVSIVERKAGEMERIQQQMQNLSLATAPSGAVSEGLLAALENAYEGPGHLRREGPRHDNDFVDISEVRIAPTHDELICRIPPFLPANLHGAPHPFPSESVERLLDIQFRLLREELIAPLRMSIQLVLDDLTSSAHDTRLADLMRRHGGKYRGHVSGQDAVLFNLYTNVSFTSLSPDRRGISIGLVFDSPPGRARSAQARVRATFWENMGSKRLMQGGLVALIWKRPNREIAVHLGTIVSSTRDLVDSARASHEHVSIRVAFFDTELELRAIEELRHFEQDEDDVKLLVEATVLFESVRPFLEALQVEPETVPFSNYLVHRPSGHLNRVNVALPAYARLPEFSFQLSSLFSPDAGVDDLRLAVTDQDSVAAVRQLLRERSILDPSQADAVVMALTSELAMIQGPPGTGKSYTGVQLLRVLLANNIGPILMIAFTNHALDHLLGSVLDAGITKKIVRLGSRSADERIAEFSIEHMENVAGKSRLDRAFAGHYWELRTVEEDIKKLMSDFRKTKVDSEDILSHMELVFPAHFEFLNSAPRWIRVLYELGTVQDGQGPWRVAGRGGYDEDVDTSLYAYWLAGGDIDFLERAHISSLHAAQEMPDVEEEDTRSSNNRYDYFSATLETDSEPELLDLTLAGESGDEGEVDIDDEMEVPAPEETWMHVVVENIDEADASVSGAASITEQTGTRDVGPQPLTQTLTDAAPSGTVQPTDFRNLQDFFQACGTPIIPPVRQNDRSLHALLDEDFEDVWAYSRSERQRFHSFIQAEVHVALQRSRIMEFERLRERHRDVLNKYNEGKDETRRQLLRNVDIIGCTTTGAAKLTSLLKGIGPRIMLVEEAGQVLEAHVLGSLVQSVQHLILIGDPLQLRPTLNNFSLSVDHRRGNMLYKFDMSLMERLSSGGLHMSQIDVQRRMRPEISHLVRTTLYPKLEDHDLVKQHPHVQGMGADVFFLTHNHAESGSEDDSVSKYNDYEVSIIKDLVVYLLRQGPYSAEGDIVVLCAYLGQLARVRDALASEVVVVIDERDQRELDDREGEESGDETMTVATVERVKVTRKVLLRTVDNFQGEESKIVILSLVRNSGGAEEEEAVYGHSSARRANIGFLKSSNRINVALSRAREGLYILGNASDLRSRSKMWQDVISELEERSCVGDAFPIRCQRHPERVQHISKAGQLPRIAPDGGCLLQCDARLECGHICPYKCHSDDPNHRSVICEQRCTRLCVRSHPCVKQCAMPCGKCMTHVENVRLPCGHDAAYVYCYQLDNLAEVSCNVLIAKQLPHCEHKATMSCSQDPASILCREICGGVMVCCGRDCKAQCSQCQGLNSIGDEETATQKPRTRHLEHPCEKSLYCGHLCGKACSQDHECTTHCKEPCRQVCPHTRCRSYCSTPCAPCQEPCTWQCTHYTCDVPCGSVCTRLPCDKRCEKLLRCGHRCPSVCGEDCSIQVCPLCLDEETKETMVVDFIMQSTLAMLNPEGDALDELLITLPACRHVFTVETLDGICALHEYYMRDEANGRWKELRAPPSGFLKPPACPTCRSAITAPRYGRVFKRADLDILENNVASHMSRSLGHFQGDVDALSKDQLVTRLQEAATKATVQKHPASIKLCQKKQTALLKSTRYSPVPRSALDPANAELHAISAGEAQLWKKCTQKLLNAYSGLVNVASTRSAHLQAWEASFSYLYQKEMDSAAQDPIHAPRNPHEFAMRAARMGVGLPQPRADKRFVVEAIWTSITLRLLLVELTMAWSEALQKRGKYPADNRRAWATYTSFVLRSCTADTDIASTIASESESHRQVTKSALLQMRVDLEQFRFNLETTKQSGKLSEMREKLVERAQSKREAATRSANVVIERHRRARVGNRESEEEWLAANFTQAAGVIVDEWDAITQSISNATFYQPVSLDELTAVVKSFGFAHAGHYYKCPNGHIYVIADCGGAMEQSVCPECGASIGGHSHRVLDGNSRALDLEGLARAQGAWDTPWR
ncbi:P-loop containing nucleoside triphosphate hydrolase protein [Daedalea quercina L-15889]|uniref:p-loop containing nucleoside triphosphate hydrolase protein n=1 Tax=Daedalea quercina L-15889 TaxID=1314783 RepID=A0A165SMD7_9APHY|nr:P-loop containing nucleoside triphosphate hydrolase protein [Daedalea quercina L-15889]